MTFLRKIGTIMEISLEIDLRGSPKKERKGAIAMKRKILIRMVIAVAFIAFVLVVGYMTLNNFAERLGNSYSLL